MWILTTRGRPAMAERLIAACRDTGMTQDAILYVDGPCDGYDFPLPNNWRRVTAPENGGIGAAMNWFFAEYPALPFYGWLADDFVPKTGGWDLDLSAAAGDRYIAYCDDEWPRVDRNPTWITSAFAIGGGLVRAAGWFAAPGLRQAGIDSAWNFLGRHFGLMRYCPHTRVEHVHYKNGKRPRDATDNKPELEQQAWRDFIDGAPYRAAQHKIQAFLASPVRQAG